MRAPIHSLPRHDAITDGQEVEELHVGMRSGQSLELKSLQLREGQPRNLRISMVYPADATPGHLLSVVPEQQLLACVKSRP